MAVKANGSGGKDTPRSLSVSFAARLRMRWWSALLVGALALMVVADPIRRRRRDLLDLADMFDLVTGLDPSDYIPYGNWCGYGGRGKPIDLIDECCKIHDECYGQSENKCSNQQVHVIQYAWKIVNDTIQCGDESHCELNVCICDKEVVECIAQHSHTYSEHYRFIKKHR